MNEENSLLANFIPYASTISVNAQHGFLTGDVIGVTTSTGQTYRYHYNSSNGAQVTLENNRQILNYLICCYYTKDTEYEKVAQDNFMQSPYFSEINSANIHIKAYDNQGSWQANTALKPTFILETLYKYRDIEYFLFVDADSKIVKKPELLEELISKKVDLAFHRLDWQSWYRNGVERKELLTGTLFIRNCEAIRQLCSEWLQRANATKMWEQKVLENIIEDRFLEQRKDLTIYELPVEYTYINSLPDGSEPFVKVEPVIVHYQASRKLRKEIK